MKQNHQKSWAMAYCGIVAALCVALMLLGAVIPIAMFIAPAVAGFLVATVCVECGMQLALTAYAAVSLLALLFVPDKEVGHIDYHRTKLIMNAQNSQPYRTSFHSRSAVPTSSIPPSIALSIASV